MFSLIYGFWKYFFHKDEYFVLILGLDNAGKTTFLEQTKVKFNRHYKAVNLKKITTTVGLNVGKVFVNGVCVSFWDLGGQQELQALWDKYYLETHAIIYIVDSADLERIEESKHAFEKMIKNEALKSVPLLFVANKQDKSEALSLDRLKDIFRQSAQYMGKRDCHSVAASAILGEGINEGIEWLVNCMKRNSNIRPPHNEEE